MSRKTIWRGNPQKQQPKPLEAVTQTSETLEAERAAQDATATPVSGADVPNAPMPEPPVLVPEITPDAAALVKPAAKVEKPKSWLEQWLAKPHVHSWDRPARTTQGKD